ncbi:hypothetical protein Hanom_Chr16g01436221 [Helianthus anomalus]
MKKRHELLKKEFEAFMHIDNESLGELAIRFEDALPTKWSGLLEILKHNEDLDRSSIYEFIQNLENKDAGEIIKAKRISIPHNPEM